MTENKPFFWIKAFSVGVVGLSLCLFLVIMVAITALSSKEQVAKVSYMVTKPVRENRVKTNTYQVEEFSREGDGVMVVPKTHVFETVYTVCRMVPELREEPVEVPRQRAETIKLYVVGSFAGLAGIYFIVLLCGLVVSLITGKTSAQYVRDRLDKTAILMLGLVGGYVSAQELPPTIPGPNILASPPAVAPVNSETSSSQEKLAINLQRQLDEQQKTFLKILQELNIKVSYRQETVTPTAQEDAAK